MRSRCGRKTLIGADNQGESNASEQQFLGGVILSTSSQIDFDRDRLRPLLDSGSSMFNLFHMSGNVLMEF